MTIAPMPAERRESRPASREIRDGTATLQDSLRSLQWSAASASRTTLQTSIAANTTSAVASPPPMTTPRREPGASPWRPGDCRTEFVPNHAPEVGGLFFVFALAPRFRFEIRGQGGRSGAPLCTDTSPEAWARAGGVCACYDELIRLLAGRGAGSLCWCVPRPPLPGAPRRARRRRALGARLRSCGLCLRGRVLSTAEGHRVMYDREVPFEIRNQTDPHDSAQEVFPASARPAPSAVLS